MSELRARIAAALAQTKAQQAANTDQALARAQQASAPKLSFNVPGMGAIQVGGQQPAQPAVAPQPAPSMAFAPSAFLDAGRVPTKFDPNFGGAKSDISGLMHMAAMPYQPGSKTEDIRVQYMHLVAPGENTHNPRTKIEPVCQGDIVRFMVDTDNKSGTPRARHVSILQDGQDIDELVERGFFTGVVKSFFPEKGWGFIGSREAAAAYKADIFMHKNDSFKKTFEELELQTEAHQNQERTHMLPALSGDIVTFKVVFDQNGKMNAEHVTVVDPTVDEIQDGFFVGAVKFLREDAGWGFIASEGVMATYGVDEVFLHRRAFRWGASDAAVNGSANGAQRAADRQRTLEEPCFVGDLVQFGIKIDEERNRCKAEHVSLIGPDTEVTPGLFAGMIKAFCPERGWGFITSSQLQEVHGSEDVFVHRDNFPGGKSSLAAAQTRAAAPAPGRIRTREEPCFTGDLVQFMVCRDGGKSKCKAERITVIQEGAPVDDGFFLGVVKNFFGIKGFGFIASPMLLHEFGTEDLFFHRDCFTGAIAEDNLQRPVGKSGRKGGEPCFAGDVVQFAVGTDSTGKLKAEQLSILDEGADTAEGFFMGTVKSFFPDKGWGFIASSDFLEAHGCEDVFFHRDEFFNVSDEQKIQAMTEGVQRIQAMVDKCDGRIPIDCDLGFSCPRPTCGKRHPPEGREMLENPELLLCRYKQKCKNAECFFIHLEGREIDNDPEKGMCKNRGECTNPKCMFLHPAGTCPRALARDDRERRWERGFRDASDQQGSQGGKGGQGGQVGHGSRRRSSVVVKDLPAAWGDLSDEELKEHISWELSVFGPIAEKSIELGLGRLEAHVQFQKPEYAQAAADQLRGGDGELRVELRYPDEGVEDCAIVHIDELTLPTDTEESFPLDCEVWVDNADDADVEGWHDVFGQVEEIFRVPGSTVAGLPAGGAYVRFSLHESAAKVVDQGKARWSCSERALSNNRGSICNALLGHGGGPIKTMRDELGIRVLHLAGSGRVGSGLCLRGERRETDCMSSRLHFVARGAPEKLQSLRDVLELRLASLLVDRKPKRRTHITEPVAVNPKKPRKAPFMPSAAALGGNNDPPGTW